MRIESRLLFKLLERVEQAPAPEVLRLTAEPARLDTVRRWHAQLLIDVGYLHAQQLRRYGEPVAVSLTVAGQDYLDLLRRNRPSRRFGQWLKRLLERAASALLLAKVNTLGLLP